MDVCIANQVLVSARKCHGELGDLQLERSPSLYKAQTVILAAQKVLDFSNKLAVCKQPA